MGKRLKKPDLNLDFLTARQCSSSPGTAPWVHFYQGMLVLLCSMISEYSFDFGSHSASIVSAVGQEQSDHGVLS